MPQRYPVGRARFDASAHGAPGHAVATCWLRIAEAQACGGSQSRSVAAWVTTVVYQWWNLEVPQVQVRFGFRCESCVVLHILIKFKDDAFRPLVLAI